MKTYKQILVTINSFLIVIFFNGCKTNPLDEFKVSITPELIKYSAMLEIRDAVNPEEVPQNLKIEFSGEYANEIIDGEAKKNFEIIDGRVMIGLHPRVSIPEGQNLRITYRITANNYLPVRGSILLSNEAMQQYVQIPMTNPANPPKGVSFKTANTSLTNGQTTTVVNVEIPPTGEKNLGMKVSIPSGTEFLDRNGNKVKGTNLEVIAGHFDSNNEEAQENFPGGFEATNIILPGGTSGDAYFQTGGFTTLDMRVNGTEIKSFNNEIDVVIDIDQDMINPYTNAKIQIGDTIQIWSYDNQEATWKYERTGTVIQQNGKLVMSFKTNHLSWWNIDFWGSSCASSSPTRVTFSIPTFPANYKQWFFVRLVYASNNQLVSYWAQSNKFLGNNSFINFYNVPTGFPLKVQVYNQRNGTILAESTPFTCGQNKTVTLNVPAPVIFTLDVTGVCADKPNVNFKPSFYIYYKRPSENWYQFLTYVHNGQASTTRFELGQTYNFRIYYGNQILDTTHMIDKTNYTIVQDMGNFCKNF